MAVWNRCCRCRPSLARSPTARAPPPSPSALRRPTWCCSASTAAPSRALPCRSSCRATTMAFRYELGPKRFGETCVVSSNLELTTVDAAGQGLATHPTLPYFATAAEDKTIRLWSAKPHQCLAGKTLRAAAVSLAISLFGSWVLSSVMMAISDVIVRTGPPGLLSRRRLAGRGAQERWDSGAGGAAHGAGPHD